MTFDTVFWSTFQLVRPVRQPQLGLHIVGDSVAMISSFILSAAMPEITWQKVFSVEWVRSFCMIKFTNPYRKFLIIDFLLGSHLPLSPSLQIRTWSIYCSEFTRLCWMMVCRKNCASHRRRDSCGRIQLGLRTSAAGIISYLSSGGRRWKQNDIFRCLVAILRP